MTLSPAKIMQFKPCELQHMALTEPIFAEKTNVIISHLEQLNLDEMMNIMDINHQQAETVFAQIHQFRETSTTGAAALTYNGMVYKGLEFSSLTDKEIDYAQQHLLIGSAVYGFLRPMDRVKAYRLEMQAKLKNPRGNNMYNYWQEVLTSYLSARLASDDAIWLNLSSDEYSKVINRKILPKTVVVITPQFKEEGPKGYRQVIVRTKKARGMMAKFVIQNQITDPEELLAFDLDGYCYAEHLSSKHEPVFIK
jgi:cytoplasmic iron level regulating protein YaaA (DUF328/UPF0246 family)